MNEKEIKLGNCCICEGQKVRNLVMLHYRGPQPGTGWGCAQCGLPPDGAMAALCDDCLKSYQTGESVLKYVCDGYPRENKRAPLDSLNREEIFDHDIEQHPEISNLCVDENTPPSEAS